MKAPFPWYGGKSRWAPDVWSRLGDSLRVYVEPFAGSLAVLLANKTPVSREVVCDLDGMICNFFRATAAEPDAVAHWATYPTIHQDLTARHRWLIEWRAEHAPRLSEDAEYYDARAAGWWVWGLSNWIGGGWCHADSRAPDQIPHVCPTVGGRGVSMQRGHDKRPHVGPRGGGQGVSMQVYDKRPHVGSSSAGQGVSMQVAEAAERMEPIFQRLASRLQSVIVLNRNWTSAVTPSILQQTATCRTAPDTVGIVLDPPYLTHERDSGLYGSDLGGTSDDVAQASYEWAIDHPQHRIAYFAHAGDFEWPSDWHVERKTFNGIRVAERRSRLDECAFSPACTAPQGDLFGEAK